MRPLHPALPVSVLLLCGACGATARVVRTTSVEAPARPPDCALDLVTTFPLTPYDQLGVVDVTWKLRQPITQADDFLAAIRRDACALGADAVVAEVNARGYYTHGSLLRRTPRPPGQVVCVERPQAPYDMTEPGENGPSPRPSPRGRGDGTTAASSRSRRASPPAAAGSAPR